MALQSASNFCASTTGTPILLAFLPSTARTPSLGVTFDSNAVVGGRNSLQTSYVMSVTFNVELQELFITEHVKSNAKASCGVMGTLRIPFPKAGEPLFVYSRNHGDFIKITLPFNQAIDLSKNHYSSSLLGTWKHGTQQMLQLKQLEQYSNKIRQVDITIFNAPKAPSAVRTHILSIFNQHTSSQPGPAPASTGTTSSCQESTTASTVEPTKHGVKITDKNQQVQVRDKAKQDQKHHEDEEARPKTRKQEFVQTDLASEPFNANCSTLCIASVMSETEARNLLPWSCEDWIVKVDHVTDFVGESYFLFDFGCTANAQKALEAATHWAKLMHWIHLSPVVALINDQTKSSILLSAIEEATTLPSGISNNTTEDTEPDKEEEETGEIVDSSGEQMYPPSESSSLRCKLTEFEDKHQLCQEQVYILLRTVGALRQQEPSEELLEQILDEEAVRTSSSVSRGRALLIKTAESEESVLDIIDRTDRVWITKITSILSDNNQKGFKIDFVSHGTASEALRNTRHLILDNCDEWRKRPTIDFFHGECTARGKRLSTKIQGAYVYSPPIYQSGIDEGLRVSRVEIQKLELQVQDLKENYLARGKRIEVLQEEVHNLKQQLDVPTALSHKPVLEEDSFDLLALDIESDVEETSTLFIDTNTTAQVQPLSLELELDLPGAYPASDESRPKNRSTAQNDRTAELVTNTSSSLLLTTPDTDTILKIDNAVEAMAYIQKCALRAGKAVTIEVKEAEEMADWLKQRNNGIISSPATVGTLVTMWL